MFFTGVCHSVNRRGVSASVHAGILHPLGSRHSPGSRYPPGADTPTQSRHPLGADTLLPQKQTPLQEQTPPQSRHPPGSRQHPPGADTPHEQTPPRSRHPPGADTPGSRHPPMRQTPPWCRACWEIWLMCGWYASYWNAFLFGIIFQMSVLVDPKGHRDAHPLSVHPFSFIFIKFSREKIPES